MPRSSSDSKTDTRLATRSRSGCLTCRARKLRCDKNEDGDDDDDNEPCGRCARLGMQCITSNNASLSQQERAQLRGDAVRRRDLNQAGFVRLRSAASCQHCRSRRQKCSGDRPTCARCLQSNRICVYDRGIDRGARDAVRIESAAAHDMEPASTNAALGAFTSTSLTSLHDKVVIRTLVERFFHEISPLRCFGFIHEPSFMLRMDYLLSHKDKDPLLLTVCALATRTINQESLVRSLGAAWAHTALTMVRNQAHRISVNVLMCLVLLNEFFVRVDEVKQCFILTCLACRLCQALQLNVEYDDDFECKSSSLSPTEKETRRRLMWASYCMDTSISGGLDSIKMFREEDSMIQMPADEDSFFYRTAGMTSFLRPAGQLGDQEHLRFRAKFNQDGSLGGYRAYYIHLIVFRERVLRYLKRRDQEENPSRPLSEFNLLVSDLEYWRSSLPQNLRLTPEVIYIRTGQGILSALFDLHTGFHQCGCDLYRAMIPELQLPPRRQNNMTMTAPTEFLVEGKRKWFQHACQLTEIFRLAMAHAPKSMTEPNTAGHAYTAIRTKLYYHLHIMADEERAIQSAMVDEMISTDLEYLRRVNELHPMTARTLACSEELVRTLDPRSGGTRPAEEETETAHADIAENGQDGNEGP